MKKAYLFFIFFLVLNTIFGFQKNPVVARYHSVEPVGVSLMLYKDSTFRFTLNSGGYLDSSRGRLRAIHDTLFFDYTQNKMKSDSGRYAGVGGFVPMNIVISGIRGMIKPEKMLAKNRQLHYFPDADAISNTNLWQNRNGFLRRVK